MALWLLLPASVARVGKLSGLLEGLEGLEGLEAFEPLLWLCGGFCMREWRVLGLLAYLLPAELGGLLERLEGLRPGKRQP